MELYLFKSGVSLACFYAIYLIFIRHNHRFSTNRYIILGSVLISGILPVIYIDWFFLENYQVIKSLNPVIISDMDNSTLFQHSENSYSIYLIIYIIGLMFFSIRSIIGVATLFNMYLRYQKKNYHGFKAVIIDGNQSPFTFFNILFISGSDFNKEKIDEMIVHEQAHRDQYHSIDSIFMEIMTIIHWFNPIVWLFKYDLKSEHEFMADEQVLKKGFDKIRYQHLLLQANEGVASYLANNFNYSILKKRLKMMSNQNSKRAIKLKYALALPLLLISASILSFSFQIAGQLIDNPDVMPVYKSGNDAMYKTIGKNLSYPKEARSANVQGTVYVSFTVNPKGNVEDIEANDDKYHLLKKITAVGYIKVDELADYKINNDLTLLEKECERVVSILGEFTPGEKESKPVSVRVTLPIEFKIR